MNMQHVMFFRYIRCRISTKFTGRCSHWKMKVNEMFNPGDELFNPVDERVNGLTIVGHWSQFRRNLIFCRSFPFSCRPNKKLSILLIQCLIITTHWSNCKTGTKTSGSWPSNGNSCTHILPARLSRSKGHLDEGDALHSDRVSASSDGCFKRISFLLLRKRVSDAREERRKLVEGGTIRIRQRLFFLPDLFQPA